MDELAGRYLTLCLRLSRLLPGLVDWYTGPDRLLAAVHAEPQRLPDRLATEADRLAADVATEATLPTDRADWLTAQLVCLSTTGRARAGDVLSLRDHVRHVLGVPPDGFDEQRAETARAIVEELVPGPGPLADRVARHLGSRQQAGSHTVELFTRAVELLRPIVQQAFTLPDDEYVQLRPEPAGVALSDARPDGRSATRVTVSQRGATLVEILTAAARSTYPGAHTIRVLRTALLVEQFGRGECTLEVRSSPGRVASAGAAAVGTVALLAPHERELLLDRLADRAGTTVDARSELLLHDALDDLQEAVPAAGMQLHAGDERGARALLDRYRLRPGPSTDAVLDSLADRDTTTRAHIVPVGRRLTLGFLAKQPDGVAGFQRLVTEQLTPAAFGAGR